MDYLQVIRDITLVLVTKFLTDILGPLLAAALVLIIGNRILAVSVRLSTSVARRARVKPALVDLLGASVTGIGWVLIAVGILQIFHLDTIALAVGGSLSLVALGIASAASGNLGDIISGIFLASDPDFGNGFTIRTGDLLGTIEHIDLRKTRMRTEDGKLHIIPNKEVESKIWIVEGRPVENPAEPIIHTPAFFRRKKPGQIPPATPSTPPSGAPANPT